jgi:hypothetical protein
MNDASTQPDHHATVLRLSTCTCLHFRSRPKVPASPDPRVTPFPRPRGYRASLLFNAAGRNGVGVAAVEAGVCKAVGEVDELERCGYRRRILNRDWRH